MKLLVVEDDPTNLDFLAEELRSIRDLNTTFAVSRDGTFNAIEHETFDLIVLDLRIPTQDGELDADPQHGLAVHAAIRERVRGTPILVFSAFGTLPVMMEFLDKTVSEDLFGTGELVPMTRFFQKSDLANCLRCIRNFAEEIRALEGIEISFGVTRLALSPQERRILQIFARGNDGSSVRVSAIGGGLSKNKSLRLVVSNLHRDTCHAFGKLGEIRDLDWESDAYLQHVAPMLKIGTFPHMIRMLRAGAGAVGGLFHALALEYDSNVTEQITTDPTSAAALVASVRALEAPWQNGATYSHVTVGEIRRRLIPDAEFHPLASKLPFDWAQVEKTRVRVANCCCHGDLHGLNVLLREKSTPLLIDFAWVGLAPASLDPLVLELSLVFHPECRTACPSWPSIDQAREWVDLSVYSAGCPVQSFVEACRKWAFDCDAGDKAVMATAYAYSVRQLKFNGPTVDLAIAIAASASGELLRH